MSTILILVASQEKNMALAQDLKKEVQQQGSEAEIVDLVALNLPLYPNDDGSAQKIIAELTAKVTTAQALLSVAPEYNGSIPPCLNNALAWISTSTKEWRNAFANKPVALATHSGGGGAHVLLAMRTQFSFIGCDVIGRQILTHFQKPLNPESATAVIAQLLKYSAA